ncbi:hypothetical protein B0H11DRAFT_719443 [Mycena galericulata]|nr:hypothetical protein B0H11DRAFT_719443 [Mycena galericulata]
MPSDISSPWLSRGMGRWNDQPSPTSSTHSSPKSPQLALPDLNPRPLDRNLKGKRKAGAEQHSSLFGTRQSTSTIPREQTEGWHRARESVSQALGNFLTQDQLAAHNLRDIVSDSVKAIPIQYTALQIAADLLLSIWDGVQEVEFNRLSSLRLTERSANILHALIQELLEVGFDVSDAIARPMEKLIEALTHVRDMLRTLVHQPFLKRYLKRDETLREIMSCDSLLSDALEMFSLSLQIRVLKQIQTLNTGPHRELETHELEPLDTDGDQATRMDNDTLLDQLAVIIEQMSDGPSVEEFPGVLPLIDRIQSTESESDAEKDGAALREIFELLQSKQNKLDLVNDTADLRAVVQTALTQNSDVEMLRMLQLNREDLPEVMKILQRAVDDVQRLVKDGEAPPAYTPGAAPPQYAVSILDQKLIVGVRDALRRVSEASAPTEPSWTISRYDVSREDKIGVSFFADVYKGTCRGRAAAIKYVTEGTPQTLFEEAVDSWKDLKHPHVLELLGANAESGGGRLFFVYPYKPHGSLDAFLRRVAEAEEAARSGREGELVRYMHEIAQGMQYLHEHGVVHGDLKAANILVDDSFHCVVADFGQNAMKAAVALSSNVPPPHGTLRWRAPELLLGSSELTPATDVYAYAMCCVEILSWGRLPWPLIGDDGVLDLVLREKRRPDIPSTHFDDLPLPELVQACWVDDPVARPPFCQIVEDTEELCTIAEIAVEYPPSQASSRAPSPHLAKVPESPNPEPTSRQGTLSSRLTSGASSLFELGSAPGIASAKDVNSGGYESPTSDKRLTEIREERRYRMLLVHNFHPSLTLPLWNPVHVAIGDVGFFDRESNTFMTLFNCFSPDEAPEGDSQIPSVHEYGQVKTGSQRQNTRSAVQRSLDVLAGRFSLKKDDETASPTVSRRYSYPLRAGYKAAYLCTETTNYRYMEELKAPKEWFKANVDSILHQYGRLHEVVKEDLRLVVGTLDTPDYALFVSHNHPDGEVHFNVFSSTKSGKPWGAFTTEVKEQGGSSYQNSANKSMLFSCKVSPTGGPWNTVLLASLSFKHDVMEPTTLGHAVGSARFLARQKVPTVQPILSSVAKATTSEVDQATAGASRLPTTSHFPIIYPAPAVAHRTT